ncbi:hypothetical protein SELMODRAFT_71763, partial [Selaginella moellendorffii]
RNALIYMFAECGSLDKARGVFDGMDRDSVSWNTIFTAYGNDEVLRLLREFDLTPPCDITLNVVLLACNHSGLQEEAWYHFTYTSRDYGVELKRVHYHCMLDVLARQDLLEEACHLLTTMP